MSETTTALIVYDSVTFRAQDLLPVPPPPDFVRIEPTRYTELDFFELPIGKIDQVRNPFQQKTIIDTSVIGDGAMVPETEVWHIKGVKAFIETTHRHNIWQHMMLLQAHQTGVITIKVHQSDFISIPMRDIFAAPKTTLTDVSRLSTDSLESWYDLGNPNSRMIEGGHPMGLELSLPLSLPSGVNFRVNVKHYEKAFDHYREFLSRFYDEHYSGVLPLPLDKMPYYHDEYKLYIVLYGHKEMLAIKAS